jgi:hypothetical protein
MRTHARTHAQEYDKSTTAELEEAYQACLGTLSVRLMTVRSCFIPLKFTGGADTSKLRCVPCVRCVLCAVCVPCVCVCGVCVCVVACVARDRNV